VTGSSAMTIQAPRAGVRQVVLDVRDLRIHYETPKGDVVAVGGISFQVFKGEILGLVGESGCGKTTAAMGILRSVQAPGRIVEGSVQVNDTDIMSLSEAEFRDIRWRSLALIPQAAMNSLNPLMRVHQQISDVIVQHEDGQSSEQVKQRILSLFNLVGLPARVYNLYPHELSGGMKQRVCIAMAIALNPPLIIADEPTSALDVVVQRLVAQTLVDVKNKLGVSLILIGHDMGLQAQLADRVAVMYAGKIVEIGPARRIFKQPQHPYTQLLISAIPSIRERKPLQVTEGLTHDLRNPPPGCVYQFRCPHAEDCCREGTVPLVELAPDHLVACDRYPLPERQN
jgi:peptide/nickel transport system ATP-binding protein